MMRLDPYRFAQPVGEADLIFIADFTGDVRGYAEVPVPVGTLISKSAKIQDWPPFAIYTAGSFLTVEFRTFLPQNFFLSVTVVEFGASYNTSDAYYGGFPDPHQLTIFEWFRSDDPPLQFEPGQTYHVIFEVSA